MNAAHFAGCIGKPEETEDLIYILCNDSYESLLKFCQRSVTLKIEIEKGIYRWGDATLIGREKSIATYLEDYLIPGLLGRDRFYTEDIWQYF